MEKDFSELIESLYALHFNECEALAAHYTHDDTLAEDIVHDVFVFVMSNGHLFKDLSAKRQRGYLRQITTNMACNAYKSAAHETYSVDTDTFEAPCAEKKCFEFASQIEQMPEKMQRAMMLYCAYGYRYNEAADTMGCSEENVRQLVCRGRRWLRG
jgi:RNA polymerase sigma factor (sigma-70 family)